MKGYKEMKVFGINISALNRSELGSLFEKEFGYNPFTFNTFISERDVRWCLFKHFTEIDCCSN